MKKLIPASVRNLLRPLWWRWLRWPMPLWRTRGWGYFTVGGERLRFHDVARQPQDWWAWIAREGKHEPEVAEFLARTIRPDDVFFDIGAYMGQYSLLAARKARAWSPSSLTRRHSNSRSATSTGTAYKPKSLLRLSPAVTACYTWTRRTLAKSTSRSAKTGSLAVRTIALDDRCRSYVKRSTLFAVIWGRVGRRGGCEVGAVEVASGVVGRLKGVLPGFASGRDAL